MAGSRELNFMIWQDQADSRCVVSAGPIGLCPGAVAHSHLSVTVSAKNLLSYFM